MDPHELGMFVSGRHCNVVLKGVSDKACHPSGALIAIGMAGLLFVGQNPVIT